MVAAAPELLTPRWRPLQPHETQYALWSSEALYNVAEAGRRSGKSELAKRKGVNLALTHHVRSEFPDGHYKFGAPTRDQAKHIYWDDLQALVPSRFVRKISESELWIQLINGARLWVVGLDAVKRIEGQPMDHFFGDEAQEWKQGIFDRTLWPALQDRNGRAWIYGVPRPGAEFEELAKRARSGDPEWAYFKWRSETVLGADRLAGARRRSDPRMYEQEYGAERISLLGRAYYMFSRQVHGRERVRHLYNQRAVLRVDLDFNVEPGIANVSQRVRFRTEGNMRLDRPEVADVIDAYLGVVHIPYDSNTHRVCRKIIDDWGTHQGLVHVYGDPAGGQRKTSAEEGQTDWSIVRDVLGRHFGNERLLICVQSSAPLVRERINAMNNRLMDGEWIVHTLIDPEHCEPLLEDFDLTTTLPGTAGELDKRDKRRTHHTDAAGYRAEFEFGPNAPIEGGSDL